MNEAEHSSWAHASRWQDQFDLQEALQGGGQGQAFRALRKSDQTPAFVKAIKSNKDPERRARFFREATAYDSFDIVGIPKLIESNAHLHKNDLSAQLYIATTFIEGPTITRWRAEATPDLQTGVDIVLALLEILEACHAVGCVHRDVKPDNIILAGGDPSQPHLLDFGLSYHEVADLDFQTEHGQEVGNRFLRLPELSAGSLDKQDPRSDVSFAAGILFYILTGEHPDVLQDGQGRLPHQRTALQAKLQTIAGSRFPRLASIFDSAFVPILVARFSNAEAFADRLRSMMVDPLEGGSPSKDLAAILALTDTEAERRRVKSVQRLDAAVKNVDRVFRGFQDKLKNAFALAQTGYNVTATAGRNTLIFRKSGSDETLLSVPFEVLEAGDELMFTLAGETTYRTDLDTPEYGTVFSDAIEAWLLNRLRRVMDGTDVLPPEADLFREKRPHAHLDEARDAALLVGKRILAFVYDPTQDARGQLGNKLGYFLQNRKTRDAMNSAFAVALVPLSQVIEISPVLNGQSMEGARWVLFEADNSVLEQDVIYANPEEGEKIMKRLVERYGPQVASSGLKSAPTT